MLTNERAAYLRGLADGLDLDKTKPEGKLIDGMLDLIFDMSAEIGGLYDHISMLEDAMFEDEYDEYDDEDYEFEDEENPDYEVKCPDCGAEIVVDEDTLLEGEISCPNCGNELEFDFTSLFSDEVCDCCDPDCEACNPESIEF
ncbi:MAG: hypothetical protein VZR54_00370 [Ruminococcus sp.]|jgi:DNA-directed RNA polymerase subunit RPC12/RpoP|nr:hypothetical protein [Ruminococcus sp.]